MQLPYQDIRRLILEQQMITDPLLVKTVINGKSAGLSGASYDARIAHDLVLGVNPSIIMETHILLFGFTRADLLQDALRRNPPYFALAHTIEDFNMPNNVSAAVADKSTYARVFVSAFNTFFDPGFRGNATLELVNFNAKPFRIKAGDPICQFIFEYMAAATEKPYDGKYQDQGKTAQPAIYENVADFQAAQKDRIEASLRRAQLSIPEGSEPFMD